MKPKYSGVLVFLILIFTSLVGQTITPASTLDRSSWQSKVEPGLLSAVQNGETEFLVVLKTQADLSPAAELETKDEKGTYVFQTLTELAEATQESLRVELDALGVAYLPFWITNMIWVRGDLQVLQQMATHPEVAHLVSNPRVPWQIPAMDVVPGGTQSGNAIEWNIALINAPAVWAMGYTGQGIVIAGQDTGYQWEHPALIEKYRGWNGDSADHNYNWHDTVTSGGGICGAKTTEPCDDTWHGTHTMGIMVGDDGGANQIGVAPGARWIGCRNMDRGVGTPASYIECYQWFIAPTDLLGQNANPLVAPHVINNSWSCPPTEGCIEPGVLITAVQSVRAAGIVTVHSAGNSGSDCGSVDEPAGMYAESFSVGATDRYDNITDFSSRGPATIDSISWLKPDVTAPGLGVRSSFLNDRYIFADGTSMAAPHVAGLVALLLSANPGLIGDVDRIEELIEANALARTAPTEDCGDIPGTSIPNNTYGWGRIDAWSTVLAALKPYYFPLVFK